MTFLGHLQGDPNLPLSETTISEVVEVVLCVEGLLLDLSSKMGTKAFALLCPGEFVLGEWKHELETTVWGFKV